MSEVNFFSPFPSSADSALPSVSPAAARRCPSFSGGLCSPWGGIPGGVARCCTFLENGPRHLACSHFPSAVSHCKRSIFMEDLQLLSWKILSNSECSATTAEKTTGLFRECMLGWEHRLDRVAELSRGKLLNHKPVEAGRVPSASITMCLSSYTFLQAVAIACYRNWAPRKAAAWVCPF